MAMPDINTIPKQAQRAKAEGIPLSYYAIKHLVKSGKVPARYIGTKPLVSYNALIRYISCEDGCDNAPQVVNSGYGIRRVEVG